MTTLIYNTIKKPAGGSVQDDFDVVISLSWNPDLASVAINADDDSMLSGPYRTQTNADGYWSVEVVENDAITPVDSVYKITETERGSSSVMNEYYISVAIEATPGDRWVGDMIVPAPAWED